jgi:hypothetical protein
MNVYSTYQLAALFQVSIEKFVPSGAQTSSGVESHWGHRGHRGHWRFTNAKY